MNQYPSLTLLVAVKIAISAGEVHFSNIGNELSSHYVIIGDPIWQVKSLQEEISPRDVLVTPKAWFYVQETFYIFEHKKDAKHFKVKGFSDLVGVSQRQYEAAMRIQTINQRLEEENGGGSLLNSSISHLTLSTFDRFAAPQREHFCGETFTPFVALLLNSHFI